MMKGDRVVHPAGKEPLDLREGPFELLQTQLGPQRWRVWKTSKGAKARRGWLTVSVKPRKREGQIRWRARLRDGFPRELVAERWGDDPVAALQPVIAQARAVDRFCSGNGILPGLGQTWLGHRLWQAVRPVDAPGLPADAPAREPGPSR